jgi:DNA-binding transcriptional ArsR family regulator
MTLHEIDKRQREDPRVALLKELADPLRLRVVDRLGHAGPATVSELAAGLGVPMPQLSNHLRRLREAGLVRVERRGRHALYSLADEGVWALLPLLDRLTGRVAVVAPMADAAAGRTCYDHLGGRLGVALYAELRARDALRDAPDGNVTLGPAAADTFAVLGVDPAAAPGDRRRFAFECFDATQHASHLAGALGDELARALGARGWIEPAAGREVRVTPAGARGLRSTLGLAW